MKQHDRQSTMSHGSRSMARDPQERSIPTPTRTPTITAAGKTYAMPEHGEVILTFHDGQLRYIERRTKEKVE